MTGPFHPALASSPSLRRRQTVHDLRPHVIFSRLSYYDSTTAKDTTTMAEKPSVLIIGGLGYIGRFLALHIHKNELASEVRLVDKVLPQLAWLAPEFSEACSQDKFMQADASRPGKSRATYPTACTLCSCQVCLTSG